MKVTPEDIRSHLAAHSGRTVGLREIIRHFAVPERDRPAFRRMVKDLAKEGYLVRVRGGRYTAPESLNLVEGILQGHPEGYAFVVPRESRSEEARDEGETPEGSGADVFVPPSGRAGAVHGDRVIVRSRRGLRGKWEGEVVRVLERGAAEVVGRLEGRGGRRWFVPLDRRFGETMEIERGGGERGARKGMVAVLRITRYPSGRAPARGRIVQVLGFPEDSQVEADMICAEFGIGTEFPEEVVREAGALAEPGAEDFRGREDLRDLLTFTIDGETARDFDDAVSLEVLPCGGCRLGVHIADVGYYVTDGSALDKEARHRGTSAYFPGRAIPMLPPALSENVCSLVPGKERLTLTVFLDYDPEGVLTGVQFAETVIRSRARLTYSGVSSFLDGEPAAFSKDNFPPDVCPPERYEEIPGLEETLREMARLARRLRERRLSEGGLDFDIPEAEVLVDAEGRVTGVLRAPRTVSHQIIEDFMLAANRAVAERLAGSELEEEERPGMFRVHEPPDPQKLKDASLPLRNLRFRVPGLESGTQEALRLALEGSRGETEEALVNMILLRAMKLARYDSANLGHFGLGFTHYTHFTSPIRRYPDLLVHRLVRAFGLTGRRKMGRRRLQSLGDRMQTLAEEASSRERAAENAERAMVDYKRVQFMKDKVGETFEGKVSGIVQTGFFVTLDAHFVDGFVRLSDLTDDYYIFDQENYELTGRRTKRAIRLGDVITVRVDRADLDMRRIDFSLVEPTRRIGRRISTGLQAGARAGGISARRGKERKVTPRKRPRQSRRAGRRRR
ncbi:MAG: ribonuclease R [Nitrospinota bacterium]